MRSGVLGCVLGCVVRLRVCVCGMCVEGIGGCVLCLCVGFFSILQDL